MNQMNHNENLQYWASLIEDAVSSGLTRAEWCEAHGISVWTYYYWNRKLKKLRESGDGVGDDIRNTCTMKPETDPVFYELPVAVTGPYTDALNKDMGSYKGSPMILEFGAYRLTIPQDVDADTLRTVIMVASHA